MYRILLLFCFAYGLQPSLNAQSISQQAGALSTDFVFTLANKPFIVTNQQIMKRASAYSDGTGVGYGYESFHLQFATSDPGLIARARLVRSTYFFTFYDKDDKLLLRQGVDLKTVDSSNSIVGDIYFYSLNLINLPFPLLDITRRIDIVIR